MALELDDVIERINPFIDGIEGAFGKVGERKETVAFWLLLTQRAINMSKENWAQTYKKPAYPQLVMTDMYGIISMGICCLEQYTDIYEESCPWEHDFSYDDKMEVEEFLLLMEDRMDMAKHSYYHDENDMLRETLSEVKEMVILAISCLLQHGN